ncbi:unnamed protein product, partial [Closterium sp. NIES-54]
HMHCAQKLGAHLHILFTMPWRPTAAYAHPFAPSALRSLAYLSPAVLRGQLHRGSYRLVEAFVGAGVMDITNQFRTRTLHLDPLFLTDRPFSHLLRLPIPFSFSWSPLLAPKPSDWNDLVDVVGFIHPPLHHAPNAREASAAPPATPSPSPSEGEALDTAPSPESPTLPALEENAARPAAAAAVAAGEGEAGETEEQVERKPAGSSDPTPPSPPSFHPPPALVSFLAEGPPPLFLAYGSMHLSKPCYVARCVLKAVALLGVRAIIGSAAIRQHRCCSSSHCLMAGGRIRKGRKGGVGAGRRSEEGGGKRGGKGRRGRRSERNVEGREAGGVVEGGGTQGGAEEGGGCGEGGGEGESEVVQQGSVLFVGSVAHDWLFPHCSATVHHGGAGTVAASIRAGCPILPMPFFGDQHFWAAVLHSLGVAPPALPIHRISPRRLLSSLRLLRQPPLKARAMELKSSFLLEGDGLLRAAHSFHLHLPPRLRCLLHEGPEQADRVCGGSRALDVVGLCGNPVPCGGRELECVYDSCVGSSQQQDRQGLAGQEMEEEAEIALEVLPRRRRFLPKSWGFWKQKEHQEQPSDSQ